LEGARPCRECRCPEEQASPRQFNSDVCGLDGSRFFIRGIAFVPILESDKRFG